ncbi:hypothetical protein DFJ74DRAFT_491357 [Hyaloraphidium curvatum]|nr:hypothetical protein DFJ74DRAFT_491357 [Hyaloraphidium curvatum]
MSCFPCLQQEFVRLIKNCYPTTAAQEVANSSAVSYLCFYCNSHPSRLPGVSKDLAKRIRRDHSSNRIVNARVGLEVVAGLCSECYPHFARFGKTVIAIFLSILDAPVVDNDVFNSVMDAFAAFSKRYDHSVLDFDNDFRKSYKAVLGHCRKGALLQHSNPSKQNRTRLLSLKAIHAVVSHGSFVNAADIEAYLDVMLYAVGANIRVPVDPAKEPPAGEGPVPPDSAVSREAESVLIQTMRSVNGGNFWRIMRPFYKTSEELGFIYTDPLRAEYMLDVCVTNVNPIYRPSLVDVAVKRLLNVSNTQLVMPSRPLTHEGQLTMLRMLTKTIATGGLAVGVTVLELVDNLTKLLYKAVDGIVSTREADGKRISPREREELRELEDALVRCIGALAISIYYPTQINDIIGFIVNRLQVRDLPKPDGFGPAGPPIASALGTLGKSSVLTDEQLTLLEARKGLMRCLRQVMENSVSGSQSSAVASRAPPTSSLTPAEDPRRSSMSIDAVSTSDSASNLWSASVKRVPVPEDYVVPMMVFLESPDVDLRLDFGLFLYFFLNDTADWKDDSATPNAFAPKLRHDLHLTLYRSLFLDYALPSDCAVGSLALASLLQRYGPVELVDSVPLAFALQDKAAAVFAAPELAHRKDAIFALVARFLESAASHLGDARLHQLVAPQLQRFAAVGALAEATSVQSVEALRGLSWSDVVGSAPPPGLEPLQRQTVVDVLAADPSLMRPDMKDALSREYDPLSPPVAYVPEAPKEVVKPMDAELANVFSVPPTVLESISSEPKPSPPTKPVVDVDNLKKALDRTVDARTTSPTPSQNPSVGTGASPPNGKGRSRDSETNSLTQSTVSVARLEKKKALSAEAATILANVTGAFQLPSAGRAVAPKANGSAPTLSPASADKGKSTVRLVIEDTSAT